MFSRSSKLIGLLILAAGTNYYYFGLLLPQAREIRSAKGLYGPYNYGGDFYPIWLTSREALSRGRNPYSTEMTRQIQTGIFGRPLDPKNPTDPPPQYRAFSYPFYADLLAAPLSILSFSTLQAGGALLLPLLMVGSVILWLRMVGIVPWPDVLPAAAVLTLISYPVLEAFYALQPAILVSFLVAAALAVLRTGRFVLAGVLLALSTVKPQMVIFLAIGLLLWCLHDWQRRKPFAVSFVIALLGLLFASSAIFPKWPVEWWRTVMEYRRYTEPPLMQLIFGRFAGDFLAFFLLAFVARVCWQAGRLRTESAEFSRAIALVLAATVVVLPSSLAVYDQVILLPGILWSYAHQPRIDERRSLRWLYRILGIALAWQWVGASCVAFAALLAPGLRHNGFILTLPLRMAAVVPFVLLATLGLFSLPALRPEEVMQS